MNIYLLHYYLLKIILSPLISSVPHQKSVIIYMWSIPGHSVLIQWLICLYWCQYGTVFITILYISSKSGSATPPTWLFCFKVAWAVLSHLHFRCSQSNAHFYRNCSGSPPCFSPPPRATPGLWEITRLTEDTPHLFLISRVALSFTVWCPVPWKHHFTYFAFFPFGCFRQKGKSSSCSPVLAISRLVVTIVCYLID